MKFRLFLSLILYLMFSNTYINNIKLFGIYMVYAKDIHYQIDVAQQIKQLHQTYEAHTQCLIQLQQQLLENQQDIDVLRGTIQNIQHQITESIHDQKKSYEKLSTDLNNYHNNVKLFSCENLSNATPIVEESVKKNIHNKIKERLEDELSYKEAVSLVLKKKQYLPAIQSFQDFIKNYPKSDYQPNAHYWLGQLYYNQGNKQNASYYFALVVKNYPKSPKASDALLKIGIIMQEDDQKDKAKSVYRQVGKLYPNSDAAIQAQKRLIRL